MTCSQVLTGVNVKVKRSCKNFVLISRQFDSGQEKVLIKCSMYSNNFRPSLLRNVQCLPRFCADNPDTYNFFSLSTRVRLDCFF